MNRRCFIFLFVLFKNIGELARTSMEYKSPMVYILPCALNELWRENRGSVKRLVRSLLSH